MKYLVLWLLIKNAVYPTSNNNDKVTIIYPNTVRVPYKKLIKIEIEIKGVKNMIK